MFFMEEKIFTQAQLTDLATRLLNTGGLTDEAAALISDDLVSADMRDCIVMVYRVSLCI